MKHLRKQLNKIDKIQINFGCVVHPYCVFKVDGCVFRSLSLLFVYMCMRMPSSPRSIPGFPIYCTQLVCVPDVIGGLTLWRH